MKKDQKQKAMYLFRELGNIDDALIADALNPRIQASPRSRVLLLAACLTLSAVLIVSSLSIALRQFNMGDGGMQAPDMGSVGTAPEDWHYPLLEEMLVANRDTAVYETVDNVEELDFFAPDARVVWQYADSNSLCVSRPLSENETDRLLDCAKDGKSVTDAPKDPACRVWILLGNGRVITPYLRLSNGNVGYAELFAYSTEVIPSTSFTSALSDILTR